MALGSIYIHVLMIFMIIYFVTAIFLQHYNLDIIATRAALINYLTVKIDFIVQVHFTEDLNHIQLLKFNLSRA